MAGDAEVDLPVVGIWAHLGSNVWALDGEVIDYDDLTYQPRDLEAGDWELTMPYDTRAAAFMAEPPPLVTIDWLGHRSTWRVGRKNPHTDEETGDRVLTVSGGGALGLLGHELAWSDPTVALGSQPTTPPRTTGAAETVIRSLVSGNYVTRRGGTLALEADGLRGSTVNARPQFHNLLELVTKKARVGGVSVNVNLVNTSTTRATLTLQVRTPNDLSGDVLLSEKIGTLGGWSQNSVEPTCTKAIVTGVAGVRAEVTTTASNAAATAWGGHRVLLVNGPTSYDATDLTEVGTEAIKEGGGTLDLELKPTNSEGLMAFRDYGIGDKVSASLETGLVVADTISSIQVKAGEGYPEVVPTFGSPSAEDPIVGMAEVVRAQNRRLRQIEQKGN